MFLKSVISCCFSFGGPTDWNNLLNVTKLVMRQLSSLQKLTHIIVSILLDDVFGASCLF